MKPVFQGAFCGVWVACHLRLSRSRAPLAGGKAVRGGRKSQRPEPDAGRSARWTAPPKAPGLLPSPCSVTHGTESSTLCFAPGLPVLSFQLCPASAAGGRVTVALCSRGRVRLAVAAPPLLERAVSAPLPRPPRCLASRAVTFHNAVRASTGGTLGVPRVLGSHCSLFSLPSWGGGAPLLRLP